MAADSPPIRISPCRLDAFIHHDQVIPVVRTIAEIFRDQDGLRENRERARLKHLFTQHGWTAERFLRELNARLGFELDPGVEESAPLDVYRDHVGIHAQKQPGLYYVGAAVLRGRITAPQMHAAAALAEQYATGELRTTNMQNLLIVNVPRENIDALVLALNAAGLHVEASPFWRGAVACTGTEFCKLAITETKSFTRWLVEELEERVPEFDQPLKFNVAGCPNACGQHWIADIGLEGKKIKHGGESGRRLLLLRRRRRRRTRPHSPAGRLSLRRRKTSPKLSSACSKRISLRATRTKIFAPISHVFPMTLFAPNSPAPSSHRSRAIFPPALSRTEWETDDALRPISCVHQTRRSPVPRRGRRCDRRLEDRVAARCRRAHHRGRAAR